MRIVTNNQPRPIISWYELTEKEKQEFDYLEQDNTGTFFRYKGETYALCDFMRTDNLGDWEGVYWFTAFSGLVVKLTNSGYVIVGYIYQ